MNPEKKWRRYTKVGSVFVNMTKYRSQLKLDTNGCLVWTGPRHRQGYGMIGILQADGTRKMTVVHRVAMRIKLEREITTREDVKHTCSNNLCCNPEHLYIRNQENSNDFADFKTSTEEFTIAK